MFKPNIFTLPAKAQQYLDNTIQVLPVSKEEAERADKAVIEFKQRCLLFKSEKPKTRARYARMVRDELVNRDVLSSKAWVEALRRSR